mmetsp:Transcript_32102/g.82205  ORF Transcript_32102/g.82205 Transcript_32102/m.82205 type:complete len:311 (-) Transcript_32102:70-1002(-)
MAAALRDMLLSTLTGSDRMRTDSTAPYLANSFLSDLRVALSGTLPTNSVFCVGSRRARGAAAPCPPAPPASSRFPSFPPFASPLARAANTVSCTSSSPSSSSSCSFAPFSSSSPSASASSARDFFIATLAPPPAFRSPPGTRRCLVFSAFRSMRPAGAAASAPLTSLALLSFAFFASPPPPGWPAGASSALASVATFLRFPSDTIPAAAAFCTAFALPALASQASSARRTAKGLSALKRLLSADFPPQSAPPNSPPNKDDIFPASSPAAPQHYSTDGRPSPPSLYLCVCYCGTEAAVPDADSASSLSVLC